MSYEPRGWPYLITAHRAQLARDSAEHLRRMTANYTTEEEWVIDARKVAQKLDKKAQDLEDKLKKR